MCMICVRQRVVLCQMKGRPLALGKKKLLRASKTSLCKTIEMGNSIAQVNCEPGSNSVTANGWLLQIHADSPPMAGFCMAFADTMHWEMVKPKNRANGASSLFMRSS